MYERGGRLGGGRGYVGASACSYLSLLSFQSPKLSVLPPEFQLTLAIFSIIGAALSLLCLTLLLLTYFASK